MISQNHRQMHQKFLMQSEKTIQSQSTLERFLLKYHSCIVLHYHGRIQSKVDK